MTSKLRFLIKLSEALASKHYGFIRCSEGPDFKKHGCHTVCGGLGFKKLSVYVVVVVVVVDVGLGFRKLVFYKVFGGLGFKRLGFYKVFVGLL